MGGNHHSRASASIFDDDEKEFIYKLPLNYDKYYHVAIYRKASPEHNFKLVVDVKLLDPTTTNYPFHRQIENSVLPYVGDDSKERLMRKHSKATISSSNLSNSSNSSHQLYDSALSQSSSLSERNNRRIYDPVFSTVEEYHFLHPNNDSSTINIDVLVMRRNGEDNEHSVSSLALIGAVCGDVVSKEDRKSFMHRLRDVCVEALNQSGSTIDQLSIEKEDQALKTITDSVIKMTATVAPTTTTTTSSIGSSSSTSTSKNVATSGGGTTNTVAASSSSSV